MLQLGHRLACVLLMTPLVEEFFNVSEREGHGAAVKIEFDKREINSSPWQGIGFDVGETFHGFLHTLFVAQARIFDAPKWREL